jgi:putative aldouronate transport system permease protein
MALPGGISLARRLTRNKYKYFFIALPFLLLVLVFSYGPVFGWVISFFNYSPRPNKFIKLSDWNSFKSFELIFGNATQRNELLRVMRNTAAISLLGLATSVLPAAFAVFLAEVRTGWYKKTVQVLTTLPNFVSWILVYSFAFALFSIDNGAVNTVLVKLGIIGKKANFLTDTSWTVWLQMCAWGLWKGVGWGAIMYLAAIAGIDQQLYEAARVDGAGRFRMMWHITVPGIMETFFVLLLLSIANFVNNGFEQYYVFQNSMNKSYIEVLDLYVYNVMVGSITNISMTTAISMLKSLISVSLLLIANQLSKLVRGYTII